MPKVMSKARTVTLTGVSCAKGTPKTVGHTMAPKPRAANNSAVIRRGTTTTHADCAPSSAFTKGPTTWAQRHRQKVVKTEETHTGQGSIAWNKFPASASPTLSTMTNRFSGS
jgi:hypothetical protein